MGYQTAIRWFKPNSRVDMYADSVVHAVADYGRFPTLCGVAPQSFTDSVTKPTYRWEFADWREGVTCKKCLAILKDWEG